MVCPLKGEFEGDKAVGILARAGRKGRVADYGKRVQRESRKHGKRQKRREERQEPREEPEQRTTRSMKASVARAKRASRRPLAWIASALARPLRGLAGRFGLVAFRVRSCVLSLRAFQPEHKAKWSEQQRKARRTQPRECGQTRLEHRSKMVPKCHPGGSKIALTWFPEASRSPPTSRIDN